MAKGNKGAGGDAPAINLAEMTEKQLLEIAAKHELSFDHAASKEELIAAILDVREVVKDTSAGTDGDPASTDGEGAGGGDSPVVETASATGDCEIGTIRVSRGVETVYVGEGKWVPAIRENVEEGKPVRIFSPKRAGKTIIAKTGKEITFDENGRATVSAVDGQYLESVIIDEKPEFTIEGNE